MLRPPIPTSSRAGLAPAPATARVTAPATAAAPAGCAAPRRSRVAAALALAAVAGSAGAVPTVLTPGPGFNSLGPSISDDGSRIAFYSAQNLTGSNPDNNFEIYLHDRTSSQTRAITTLAGGSVTGSQTPTLSGDGSRIVYQRFVPDGSFSRFSTRLHDVASGADTALTAPGFFQSSDLSRDGTRAVVNVDNTGLRVFDTATGSFGPVRASGVLSFSADAAAGFAAFDTFAGGVRGVNLLDGTLVDIGPSGGGGFNLRPSVSGNGQHVAFSATYDPLGLNADRSSEIFLWNRSSNALRQVTRGAAGTDAFFGRLNGDGSRLVFTSNGDLTGGNADRSTEVFALDLLSDVLTQVSDQPAGSFTSEVAISGDGRTVAWSRLLAGGPLQVVFDDLPPIAPPNGVPEPGTLALVGGLLGLAAAPAWRRRRLTTADRG